MATVSDVKEDAGYGVLTEAGIARLRQRVGIQVRKPTPPHNYEVTFDGTRRFANGYGDGNPLWCDRDYGKTTRWGGLIAPPNFLYTMGEHDAPELTAEQKALMKGDPLIGLGSYQAEMSFEWWRPLRLGDQLKQRSALVGVSVNENSSFGGRTVTETNGFIYRNQKDELTAIHYAHRLFAYLTFAVLGVLAWRLHRLSVLQRQARWLAALLLWQFGTGLSNVVLGWPLVAAVGHTGGAAALVVVLTWALAETRTQAARTQARPAASRRVEVT